MGGPAPALPPGLSTLPTEPRDTTAARASHGGFFYQGNWYSSQSAASVLLLAYRKSIIATQEEAVLECVGCVSEVRITRTEYSFIATMHM